MLLLKLKSIKPRKQRVFIVAVTTQERILDIITSERNHQGTLLEPFKQYRIFYIDIQSGTTSSVSFFSSDLMHEPMTLPLFSSISDDFLGTENLLQIEDSLIIEASLTQSSLNPFVEEDLRYSFDNQYRVDEEPLIEFLSSEEYCERESMVNGIFATQVTNYKKILENERNLRRKLELISEEISQSFDQKMKQFHSRELSLKNEIGVKDLKIHQLEGEIIKLNQKNSLISTEKLQESEQKEALKIQLDNYKNLDVFKELSLCKDVIESMDQKWNEIATKIGSNHDIDPIHFIIREKDSKIAELNAKIAELSKNETEDLELELTKKGMNFKKENEYVYTIDGNKYVIILDADQLFFKKIGALKPIDEIFLASPQKRASSAFRCDVSKNMFMKKTGKSPSVISSGRSPHKMS